MKKSEVWVMTNVVWYDGSDAYVSKFILKQKRTDDGANDTVTEESEDRVRQYLGEGNGEVLKIDVLYGLSFDSIVALKDYEKSGYKSEVEQFAAYERFKEIWF